MAPEFQEFLDELRPLNPSRAADLAAFFVYYEQFHDHAGGVGATAIEQTDAMRAIVRNKERPVMDRLSDLDAFLLRSAIEDQARAERAKVLGRLRGGGNGSRH